MRVLAIAFAQVCSNATLRHDRQMARRTRKEAPRSKGGDLARTPAAKQMVTRQFSVSSGTGLRGRGISCCAGSIQLDARSHGYSDRQRRINFGGVRAGSGTSAGCSAVGHARPSRVACAVRKCCCANQFFVRCFRCACLRHAYSRRGRINRYRFLLCRTSAKEQSCAAGQQIESSNAGGLLMFAPAVGAGLLMAFSRTLWAYATITEVYALNTLLILLVFFLVVRWRRRIIETRTDSNAAVTTHDTWIYAAAFVFGLAMGVHHVTVALTLPAIAAVVYRTEGLKFFTSRRLLYAALISIARVDPCIQLFAVGGVALACDELG